MERRIILDLDYCIGCRSCESACAVRFWNERRIRHSELTPPTKEAFLPSPCRHCEDALCLKACPFGVIEKNLLRHIAPKCDLCRDREGGPRCVATCPTGALQFLAEEEIPKERVGVRFISRSPYWRRV